MAAILSRLQCVNPLWFCDAIWSQRSQSPLALISSGNGLLSVHCQAVNRTNADLSSIAHKEAGINVFVKLLNVIYFIIT